MYVFCIPYSDAHIFPFITSLEPLSTPRFSCSISSYMHRPIHLPSPISLCLCLFFFSFVWPVSSRAKVENYNMVYREGGDVLLSLSSFSSRCEHKCIKRCVRRTNSDLEKSSLVLFYEYIPQAFVVQKTMKFITVITLSSLIIIVIIISCTELCQSENETVTHILYVRKRYIPQHGVVTFLRITIPGSPFLSSLSSFIRYQCNAKMNPLFYCFQPNGNISHLKIVKTIINVVIIIIILLLL